jgi:uncharacterized protein with NRDE domain
MCLIAWNWQPSSELPLLVVANRDEFYARPALALHAWPCGRVLAGKDAQAGGTWLGLGRGIGHASGRQIRFAAITNFRAPASDRKDAPTRGALVPEFLQSDASAADYAARLQARAGAYNPFNLLLFDGSVLLGFESHTGRTLAFAPGIGAVSNAGFNSPWPKLRQLTQSLQAHGGHTPHAPDAAQLLALLEHRAPAPDADLPATGIALERERALSPVFIQTPDYGTRASSVVWVRKQGAEIVEKTFDALGATCQRSLAI